MHEPFGPEYLRPAQKECPRCDCCSDRLCEKGQNSLLRCQGYTDEETRQTVADCPCSAETTKHTAAWRAAQVRVTRLARELPLAPEAEELLRSLTKAPTPQEPGEYFPPLKLRGLAQLVHGMPAITPLGYAYLRGRDDVRAVTPVLVASVDNKARTAQVEVAAWRPDELVTVLLDHLVSDCGLDAESLPGRWLEAEANTGTEKADWLVLTGFRDAYPLPDAEPEDGETS